MAASAATTVESWPCLAGGWITDEETELAETLLAVDQGHIFSQWKIEGDVDQKHAFFDQVCLARGAARSACRDFSEQRTMSIRHTQVKSVENGYPGGIKAYVNNARALLESSKAGENPFEGFKPEVRSPRQSVPPEPGCPLPEQTSP